jgi:hypothetical protein
MGSVFYLVETALSHPVVAVRICGQNVRISCWWCIWYGVCALGWMAGWADVVSHLYLVAGLFSLLFAWLVIGTPLSCVCFLAALDQSTS